MMKPICNYSVLFSSTALPANIFFRCQVFLSGFFLEFVRRAGKRVQTWLNLVPSTLDRQSAPYLPEALLLCVCHHDGLTQIRQTRRADPAT